MNESAISSISKGDAGADSSVQLELIQNVAVSISVEVGRSSLRIRDLLRLGQGIGSLLFNRILGGQHMERVAKWAVLSGNRNCLFLHRLQECRLGARRCAVYFVSH